MLEAIDFLGEMYGTQVYSKITQGQSCCSFKEKNKA